MMGMGHIRPDIMGMFDVVPVAGRARDIFFNLNCHRHLNFNFHKLSPLLNDFCVDFYRDVNLDRHHDLYGYPYLF